MCGIDNRIVIDPSQLDESSFVTGGNGGCDMFTALAHGNDYVGIPVD